MTTNCTTLGPVSLPRREVQVIVCYACASLRSGVLPVLPASVQTRALSEAVTAKIVYKGVSSFKLDGVELPFDSIFPAIQRCHSVKSPENEGRIRTSKPDVKRPASIRSTL